MPNPIDKEQTRLAIKKLLGEDHGDLALPKVEVFDLEGAGPTVVPHPHQFQPYPDVRGGSHLAREVNNLLDFVPSLQGHINRIQYGPNRDVLERLADDDNPKAQHLKGEDFANTNLLGLTNINSGHVALNPTLSNNDLLITLLKQTGGKMEGTELDSTASVLAHEAAHTLGYGDRFAYPVSDSIRDLFGGKFPR